MPGHLAKAASIDDETKVKDLKPKRKLSKTGLSKAGYGTPKGASKTETPKLKIKKTPVCTPKKLKKVRSVTLAPRIAKKVTFHSKSKRESIQLSCPDGECSTQQLKAAKTAITQAMQVKAKQNKKHPSNDESSSGYEQSTDCDSSDSESYSSDPESRSPKTRERH